MTPSSTPTAPEASGTLLERLLARRQVLASEVEPLIDKREEEREAHLSRVSSEEFQGLDEEKRKEETATYAAAEERFGEETAVKMSELRTLDSRIEEQRVKERSRELAEQASRGESPRVSVREPMTYRRDNQKASSYWLDLAAHMIPEARQNPSGIIDGYQERLERHAKEMEDVLSKRHAARETRAQRAIEDAEREFRGRYGLAAGGFDASPFETRAPTRVPGQGGYFVPPLWLVDDYIPYLRPGRVAADLARQLPLPPGTDSINIPKLLTPTKTDVQSADAAPVASQDIADTFVQANVKTIAGQEDVPIQLIEQSPGQILDEVITRDLYADYNQRVDVQLLTGSGVGAPLSGGQIVGLYPTANWGATKLTWTQGSPTGYGFFRVLGALASKTAYARFNLQDFSFLMHPRRGFWFATSLDGNNRPLVQPPGGTGFNVAAIEEAQIPAEGLLGQLPFGPRLYIDANVPTTDNGDTTGGSQDVVFGAIWPDIWLFEGDLRTRVLSEVLSGTLELRFQIFNYVAALQRFGPSVAQASGSGLAAPTGDSGAVAF